TSVRYGGSVGLATTRLESTQARPDGRDGSPNRGVFRGSAGQLAARVAPTALAADQLLPVTERLADVVPNGLRRGTIVAVGGRGTGATTLALSLLAQPTSLGSWA